MTWQNCLWPKEPHRPVSLLNFYPPAPFFPPTQQGDRGGEVRGKDKRETLLLLSTFSAPAASFARSCEIYSIKVTSLRSVAILSSSCSSSRVKRGEGYLFSFLVHFRLSCSSVHPSLRNPRISV